MSPGKLFYEKNIQLIVKFCFVGLINTAVGYGTYVLLITAGLHYVVASVISQVVGVACSYFFNKNWTFSYKGQNKTVIIKFITVYTVSYFINLLTLMVFVEILHLNKLPAGLASLIFGIVINFAGQRFWVFKKNTLCPMEKRFGI